MNGAVAIDVRGLVKSFGTRRAVDGVSMRIHEGEVYGVLGPNGSGKTTTLRLLCGLLTPDAGEGVCLGLDLRRDTAAIKRQVGYMTQRFSLYEDLSIRENLDFVARVHAVPDRRRRVDEAIDRLGLAARARQLAGTLSGGWKQRLALAACVLHRPRLLLLDEPTAGVDPRARRDFWDEIHRLAAEGITVLVSTHYMDEAERCHRLAYIAGGRKLAEGTVREVVDAAGLATWVATGPGAGALRARLEGLEGIELVAVFGAALHVSGTDPARLAAALAPFRDRPDVVWAQGRPTLEDVFIRLLPAGGEGAS